MDKLEEYIINKKIRYRDKVKLKVKRNEWVLQDLETEFQWHNRRSIITFEWEAIEVNCGGESSRSLTGKPSKAGNCDFNKTLQQHSEETLRFVVIVKITTINIWYKVMTRKSIHVWRIKFLVMLMYTLCGITCGNWFVKSIFRVMISAVWN